MNHVRAGLEKSLRNATEHKKIFAMQLLRTRFKKEIVAEFLPPSRPSTRVAIFCFGIPGMPSKRHLLEYYARKGYWVFAPRYRGSWESDGSFLRISPERDILDVLDELPKGFTSFGEEKRYRIRPIRVVVVGSSFGGPAALLASRDPRVDKVITVSAVVDWTARSKAEPLDWLARFTRDAFGNGYRFTKKNWNKLKSGTFYNPMNHTSEIDGRKIFMIHSKDDESVLAVPVQTFAKLIHCKLVMLRTGGHLSSSDILMQPFINRTVQQFLRGK